VNTHTYAAILFGFIAVNLALIVADYGAQPKPNWTPAYTLRCIVALCALPFWIVLLARAW